MEKEEVVIENHRDDIITNDNIVIKLQHSAIVGKVIQKREEFYQKHFGKMIWVVDASRFRQNTEFLN